MSVNDIFAGAQTVINMFPAIPAGVTAIVLVGVAASVYFMFFHRER